MTKVGNRQFIMDLIKVLLTEAMFDLSIKCVGSSERRFYFVILVCFPALQRRALLSVSR